jgi:uncharacterized YigZ family protein
MDINKLKTISVPGEFRLKEKGSLFLSLSYPCENEEEFAVIYSSIKKKYFDATHHCYAYKISDRKEKYSDDGEPNGTAGIRILNAINHFDLTNIAVIVVRYFGGTKLGVGPLGKTYYSSALELLTEADLIEKVRYSFFSITFDYDITSMVHHQINEFEARDIKNRFEIKPIVECAVKSEKADSFISALKEYSKGKILIEKLTDQFIA